MGSSKNQIKRILIANRGEIALRVMSTCREQGIETVSIYTESEADLLHATYGDYNICLGSGPLSETYLNTQKILKICRDHNVDAIHPGYGFLSENASFARAVREAGIIFIGPSADSIELMGDKVGSKNRLADVDVPLIPGYHGEDQGRGVLYQQAEKIGTPVLIKASAGGGGKGMRIVERLEDFHDALDAAKREALKSFGNDQVLIEKFIQNPRHIEVQVLSDRHNNHLHLYERECSIQRRYQKVVEEAPSPSLHQKTREEITRAAVNICQAIGYEGAGTVEFILDDSDPQNQKFYFLEMNTRLQVEHPVTEMVTGVDLVAEQIRIAAGKPISFSQNDLAVRGHAIEVRVYAEDPLQEFLPSTGTIQRVGLPSAITKGVRFECGYRDGNRVTIDFDPMLAKVIAHAPTREQAAVKLSQALDEYPFFGVKTNHFYLKNILSHPKFLAGQTYTHFAQTYSDELLSASSVELTNEQLAQALASWMFLKKRPSSHAQANEAASAERTSAWEQLKSFRNV